MHPCQLLLLASLAGCASAQVVGTPAGHAVRLLAHGHGVQSPAGAAFRRAGSPAQWSALCALVSAGASVRAPDFGSEVGIVLWLGDGRGGAPQVELLSSMQGAAHRLLRIAGAVGAPRLADRWVALAMPRGAEAGATMDFETDATPSEGRPTWRALSATGAPAALAAAAELAIACDEPRLFPDAVAWSAFCRDAKPHDPVPGHDFTRDVLVLVPGRRASAHVFARPGAVVLRAGSARPAEGEPPPACSSLFAVPRATGALDVEVAVEGSPGTVRVQLQAAVEDPAASARLQVLAAVAGAIDPPLADAALRATTLAEWRSLRQRLGGDFAALPDDWCDFEHGSVVAVATVRARVWPGFRLDVSEEEGVDVLAATQSAPSGRDPGSRASGLLLKLPRRTAQLAVVLRREVGPAPASERTLQVFAGH